MKKIELDGVLYEVDKLPSNCINIIEKLDFVNARSTELSNTLATMRKAATAYKESLEIEKLGENFGFFFSD